MLNAFKMRKLYTDIICTEPPATTEKIQDSGGIFRNYKNFQEF